MQKLRLHFSLLLFLVCLLFTFLAWDHYFNSQLELDRQFVANLVLVAGVLFSASAGTWAWMLEAGHTAAEARRVEAERKHREIEDAYKKLETAQSRMIQYERLASIGRFVAGLVHELKTPLITILRATQNASKFCNCREVTPFLNMIERQGNRCQAMVEDLLTLSRREKLNLSQLNVGHLIDEVLAESGFDQEVDAIRISKHYPAGEALIEGDEEQLRKLFSNLLVNAREALKELNAAEREREIEVRITEFSTGIEVSIRDNGPGMSPNQMKHLFEPFFTTKAMGKGTGLGLTLCYGIVSMHGGMIEAESHPGQGATFKIELPKRALRGEVSHHPESSRPSSEAA